MEQAKATAARGKRKAAARGIQPAGERPARKPKLPPWHGRSFQRIVDAPAMAAKAGCELERMFYEQDGRSIQKWHHFLEVYDLHIGRLIAQRRKQGNSPPLRMLEIGVNQGGSLELWRKYLGPEAVIYGIDIEPDCINSANSGCEVRIGSQADHGFLETVVAEMGGLDIVLDDGSHVASHQRASFECLFPRVAADGLYICEDLITSYRAACEGGLKRPGTYLELVKHMIDWLHDWYITDEDRQAHDFKDVYGFAKGVFGISIYDNIVVIEKRAKDKPFQTRLGTARKIVRS